MKAQLRIITRTEAESITTKRAEWCSALPTALREWCDNNGYHPRNKLGKELAIPDQSWANIFDPRGGVVSDISVYARLYVKTGLVEADPRRVPSRIRNAPRVPGRSYEEVRAWSEAQYNQWRKDYQALPAAVEPVQEISANGTGREPEAEPQTFGSLIDRLLANSEKRIALRVVEALRHDRDENDDIGKLADRLFRALVKYVDATPADRDRLMAEFGKTHLSRVFSLIRDLSSEDREVVLQLNQRRK